MSSRVAVVVLFVTLAAFVPACGGSKSSDRRDSAVPANDSSAGKEAQSDGAAADGRSPDGPVSSETAAKETTPADLGHDTALPDAPGGEDSSTKETGAADLARDTALPDAPVGLDTHGQETVRDATTMDRADASGDGTDGTDGAGASADGALAAFCTGTATRSMVNGFPGAPVVEVSRIATDCCDGFDLELNSATFATPIFVAAIASGASFVPVDIDLASPPQGWSFRVSGDCDATPSSCKEQFDSGIVGTFRTARVEDSGAIDLSLCLHVEDVDGSHKLLRSFDIYIPHAISN
jgi:hypothetical protein